MAIEYIEFNGEYHADCSACDFKVAVSSLHELSKWFIRDSGKKYGFAAKCKTCRSKQDRARIKKRYDRQKYQNNKDRLKARTKARDVYDRSQYLCATLTCAAAAEELHHVNYNEPLAVIPLCAKHHRDNHRTCATEHRLNKLIEEREIEVRV